MTNATPIELNSAERHVALLTVTWGDANVQRYAKYETDLTVAGDVYSACPLLNIDVLRLTGSAESEQLDFEIGGGFGPFDALADNSEPHAPVTVTYSMASSVTADTIRDIYSGVVQRVEVMSPGEDDERYRVTVAGIKRLFDVHLGVSATDRCSWRFGDSRCGIDLDAIKLTGEVTDVDGQTLTCSFTGGPDLTAARFVRGAIVFDGLAITIQAADGSGGFTLTETVPAGWLGEDVTVYPGCDKRPQTCRTTWSNEVNGGWLGLNMQDRYPLTEES